MADLTPGRWATALLHRLGIPANPANTRALVGWAQAEGGHWKNQASFNPLNTTQPEPGAGNTGSQGNIKAYKDWSQGLDATVATLRNGRYGGILNALKGNDPAAVARAVGSSPWGTNAALIAKTIGGASATAPTAPAAVRTPAPAATSTGSTAARGALISQFLQDRNANPVDLALQLRALKTTPGATSSPAGPAATPAGGTASVPKGRSPLLELFWQGAGGINVKGGQVVPQGFVSGHTDHVHVAAGPKTVVSLGNLAQSMGLHVGENPHFGKVNPVHAANSYHYKGEAIDVSGPPDAMRAYAHKVAALYGIK